MTPAIIISLAGVTCTILFAALGVVWRLGTRSTEMKMELATVREAVQRADESGEKWNKEVIDAIRELDGRISDQNAKIAELENKWKTAHRIAQKVSDLDNRLSGIEAVCHDRIRCDISRPITSEDGVPDLFGTERSERHE